MTDLWMLVVGCLVIILNTVCAYIVGYNEGRISELRKRGRR